MITTLLLAFVTSGDRSRPASCCDPMVAFLTDPAFMASHQTPRPLRFAPQHGRSVLFPAADGRTASGFWVPGKTKYSSAIVMVHEWWGLNDYIKREAETLHDKLGYAVLAVDLYDGKVATTPGEAGKLMGSVNQARATAIIQGAMDGLKGRKFGHPFSRVGTIGWCFGGGWSHRAAIAGGSLVKACVMYYGMPDTDAEALAKLKAPVLMVWAKQDKWINEGVVTGFESAMKANHHSLEILPFDAGHGFANPSNPVYDKAATEAAMAATLAFYRKNLGE